MAIHGILGVELFLTPSALERRFLVFFGHIDITLARRVNEEGSGEGS
jgi:hypothetical protein